MDTEERHFEEDIHPCIGMWKSIDVRALAVKDAPHGWRCEVLRATLLDEDFRQAAPWMRPPPLPDFQVLHEYWAVDRLPQLLSMLGEGNVVIADEQLTLKREIGNNQFAPFTAQTRAYERAEATQRYGLDWKTITLTGWESVSPGTSVYRMREKVDSELQSGNPPWDGLADVRRGFIGMSEDEARRNDFMTYEVLAPVFLRFGACTIEGDEIRLELELRDTTRVSDIGVSAIVLFGDQTLERRRIVVDRATAQIDPGRILFSAEVPEIASGATCILTYRNIVVDRKRLFKETSLADTKQWLAFRAFVGGADDLSNALRASTGGDTFEHAVSTLLHLLGFATGHYGQKTFGGNMTDLFAMYPEVDWWLVVECTVRELDFAAKIAKLVTRAKEVARAMPCDVRPVLVTRQPRLDISDTARGDAAREKVVLITGDDLESLVQLATEFPSPQKVWNYLQRLVPTQVG